MPNRRFYLGFIYALAGGSLLGVAFAISEMPKLTPWLLFAVAFAGLDLLSVEVNDRWTMSSGVMVLFTAGVVFAIEGSALLGMALMAATGPFVPADFKRRRVFQPAANFGQMVVSAFAAGAVLELTLRTVDAEGLVGRGGFLKLAAVGALAAFVYTVVNIGLVRAAVRFVYGKRNLLPWSGMSLLFGSQLLMGLVGGLLGGVLFLTDNAVLPLVLAVFVIGHLAFASYSQLREAHESTLRGVVKTLEARDLYTRGHTERVAVFCQVIGEQLGFSGTQLERMRWAALIHDVGKLAVPGEIMRKDGRLSDEEYRLFRFSSHKVDDLLSEVDFLRPMVEVTSGCHPRLPDEDFGQHGHTHSSKPTLEQMVLAVADAFEALTSSRSFRMAFSHRAALAILRKDDSPLMNGDIIDALEVGLEMRGERYGAPDLVREELQDAEAVSRG